MGYYAIGIGGTGVKCLESLIHLAAAGMMPDRDAELYMLFVDPDEANGSLERAVETLKHYKKFRDNENLDQPCLLQTRIDFAENPIFSPFNLGDDATPCLSDFFGYDGLKLAKDTAAHLFEVLYSEKERSTELGKGFRGHPSIGASVMAQTVLRDGDPWQTFRAKVATDVDAKIFLAGSIFGGTGAAGFPTIAELIKDELRASPINAQIGGALLLPYFTFQDTGDNELKARAEHFLMNTQAALKYYSRWNRDLVYNAIYLLGDTSQINVDTSLGGRTQRNAQHFIELYAALAAIDFFTKDFAADDGAHYFRLDRGNNPLKWQDIPDGNEGTTIHSKLRQLTYFSFAYLDIYKQRLDEIRKSGGSRTYDAPWYIDFFERNIPKLSLTDNNIEGALDNVADYCKDFLIWFANVQNSKKASGDQSDPIDEFDATQCERHISADRLRPLRRAALNKLWINMCQVKEKDKEGSNIGKFLSALYKNCERV